MVWLLSTLSVLKRTARHFLQHCLVAALMASRGESGIATLVTEAPVDVSQRKEKREKDCDCACTGGVASLYLLIPTCRYRH